MVTVCDPGQIVLPCSRIMVNTPAALAVCFRASFILVWDVHWRGRGRADHNTNFPDVKSPGFLADRFLDKHAYFPLIYLQLQRPKHSAIQGDHQISITPPD